MKPNYNRTRHLKLLKRQKSFEDRGKNFHNEEFENFFELSGYNGAICNYIQWKNRFQLASLLEEFLDGTISGKAFRNNLFLFHRNLMTLTDKFILDLDSGNKRAAGCER